MRPFIPYGKQTIYKEDIEAVVKVLKSDWLTTGPLVEDFAVSLANYCKATHAIAVSNATAALHLSCLALGVGKDDYVWTSPNSFLASANCALYCGAKVDFIDICPLTYNISVEELKKKLKQAKAKKTLPKVIIPVHFAGQSCPMEQIYNLSKEYSFSIIEDASHAIGASYKNQPVGSCKFSDITVFSFHPVKIITTGEGGAVLTNRTELAEKIQSLRTHGVIRNRKNFINKNEEQWIYEQHYLGFNYRITDIQCALGLSQLKRLDSYVQRRNYLANRYTELLQNFPIQLPIIGSDTFSSFHLYVILIDVNKTTASRSFIYNYLKEKNIGVNVHYIPIHSQPYYKKKLGFKKGDFPKCEEYYKKTLTIPLYPELTNEQQDYIVETIKEIF